MKYITTLLLATWCSPLFASVEITGPAEADIGSLVVLSVETDAPFHVWRPGKNARGKCISINGDSQMVFASGVPGEYEFSVLAVEVVVEEWDMVDGKPVPKNIQYNISEDTHIVTVKGNAPTPPDPKPDPDPKPNPPKEIYRWVADQLKYVPNEAMGSKASLARAFRSAASEISSGRVSDKAQISAITKKYTSTAVESRFATMWRDGFFAPLGKKLSELKLDGYQEHADTWNQIADALEAF